MWRRQPLAAKSSRRGLLRWRLQSMIRRFHALGKCILSPNAGPVPLTLPAAKERRSLVVEDPPDPCDKVMHKYQSDG